MKYLRTESFTQKLHYNYAAFAFCTVRWKALLVIHVWQLQRFHTGVDGNGGGGGRGRRGVFTPYFPNQNMIALPSFKIEKTLQL